MVRQRCVSIYQKSDQIVKINDTMYILSTRRQRVQTDIHFQRQHYDPVQTRTDCPFPSCCWWVVYIFDAISRYVLMHHSENPPGPWGRGYRYHHPGSGPDWECAKSEYRCHWRWSSVWGEYTRHSVLWGLCWLGSDPESAGEEVGDHGDGYRGRGKVAVLIFTQSNRFPST